MASARSMFALDARMAVIWSGGFLEFEGVLEFPRWKLPVGKKAKPSCLALRVKRPESWSAMSSTDLRARVLRAFQTVPRSLPGRNACLRERGHFAPGPSVRGNVEAPHRRRTQGINSPLCPPDPIWRSPSNWPMP